MFATRMFALCMPRPAVARALCGGAICCAVLPAPTFAADVPPHLDAAGLAAWAEYGAAPVSKAFAIAPGGSYGWVAARASSEQAEADALAFCQSNTRQQCVPYAVDAQTVFDARAWPQRWGPYLTQRAAQQAPVGTQLGERFPDLAFKAADGSVRTLSRLRGKVAIVHFWGSWCGPCRREMPDLQRLHARLQSRRDIVVVPLQVRESFASAQAWAKQQGIAMPLFDSTADGSQAAQLALAGGGRLADRDIARAFPTSYVLDKQGIVIFAHHGPVHDWQQYEAFLQDAAVRSGRPG